MATESLSIFYWEPVTASWDEGRIHKILKTSFEAGYVQTRTKWARAVYFLKLEFNPYPETDWDEVENMLDFYDAMLENNLRFYIPSWHWEAKFNNSYNPSVNTISVNNVTRFVSTPGKPGNHVALIHYSAATLIQTLEVKQITGINSPYISFATGDTTANSYNTYDYIMRAYKVRFAESTLNRKNIHDHLYTISFLFEEAL